MLLKRPADLEGFYYLSRAAFTVVTERQHRGVMRCARVSKEL